MDRAAWVATCIQVGLFPIVIHGAGPQLNKRLEDAGVEPQFIDGIRVTDAKTLEVARGIFYGENMRLVEALERAGTHARPIIGKAERGPRVWALWGMG